MKHKSFGKMQCPVARSLERVGEWWSILILRDALHGLKRFDEFERSLGISPTMLTRRLAGLVKAGLLDRRRYNERPQRYEYVLTERGRDFRSVIVALHAFGNKYFAPEGASILLVNAKTRIPADPVMVDRKTGAVLTGPEYVLVPGPAAAERTRRKLAASAWASPLASSSASARSARKTRARP
jgi:DNA-binding HxlR family transcriptional regulator